MYFVLLFLKISYHENFKFSYFRKNLSFGDEQSVANQDKRIKADFANVFLSKKTSAQKYFYQLKSKMVEDYPNTCFYKQIRVAAPIISCPSKQV